MRLFVAVADAEGFAPAARKLAEMVGRRQSRARVVVCMANPAWEQGAALQVGHPFIMPPRSS